MKRKWTDERAELLKKLWLEGVGTEQIATTLGNGITRNAVIGKAHALKLPPHPAGKGVPAKADDAALPAAPPQAQAVRPVPPSFSGFNGYRRRAFKSAAASSGQPAQIKSHLAPRKPLAASLAMVEKASITPSLRDLLKEAKEMNCKWNFSGFAARAFGEGEAENVDLKDYITSSPAYPEISLSAGFLIFNRRYPDVAAAPA